MVTQQFKTLTQVVMGESVLDSIGEEAGKLGRSVLVITDPGVRKAGLLDLVVSPLQAAGLDTAIFDGVESNPTVDNVVDGEKAQREAGADVIVAVGGGSAIDTAKAVAVLATNGGRIHDYEGFEQLKARPLPLICVPTTVGTGSETTKGAVISDHNERHKIIVVSDMMYPAIAFLDARVVEKLPPAICAATGLDALTHAIEGFVAKGANPFSDALNIQATRLVGAHLRAAFAGDRQALHQMQCAAALAGVGFHNAGLGLAHALANTLGGHFPVHHGATNGVLLPHVMRFNLPAATARFARIAEALDVDTAGMSEMAAAESAVDAVSRLVADVKAPRTLRDLQVPEDVLPLIAEQSLHQIDRPANPRENDVHDLEGILRAAY